MPNLRDLYQEVILDHSKSPRNFGDLDHASHKAEGNNPLCGDHLVVSLTMEGNIVKDLRFQGSGCAISKASASMMTEAIKGKTIAEADELFKEFHDLVTTDADHQHNAEHLGKLKIFAGVRDYPTRVKCATLAWHTLRAACHSDSGTVSTE